MSLAVLQYKGAVQPPQYVWSYDYTTENIADRSEALGTWSAQTNVVVVDDADSIVDDGITISLSSITDDATSGRHDTTYFNRVGAPYPEFTYLRTSLYVKGGTGRYVQVGNTNGYSSTVCSVFDTQTEAWVITGTNHDKHGYESLGGGAYRIWYTNTTLSSAHNDQLVGTSDGSGESYSGSGSVIYAGGYMVESVGRNEGAEPGQYIPNPDTTDKLGIRGRTRSTTAWTAPAKDNPNFAEYSDDPTTGWNNSVNVTATTQYLTIGGKNIPLFDMEDDNGAGYETASQQTHDLTAAGAEVHFSFFCLKDSIPASTRHPMFRSLFVNGSSKAYDINWATDMGVAAVGNATYSNWGVEELTDDNGIAYLHVWGSIADDPANGNTGFSFQLYPAVGQSTTLTTYSPAATGTCRVGGWRINDGAITEAPEYFGPTGQTASDTPDYFYDNGVTPNVIYLYKGAVQPTKIIASFMDGVMTEAQWWARRRRMDKFGRIGESPRRGIL